MMMDEWFQAIEGFWGLTNGRMNEQMDICECRVAFSTENTYEE